MKVKELVAKLNALNPELEVYCCTDDADIAFSTVMLNNELMTILLRRWRNSDIRVRR